MKRCVYAGSFDPLTNGHLWMIQRGAAAFDELIVAIGVNPAKRYTYSLGQRLEMLRLSLAGMSNVRVESFSQQFLADYARGVGAQYVLRGIRSESDYEYERGMRYVNEDLSPKLTTVFFIPPRSMVEVSSSMVKGLVGSLGWEHAIRKYVPSQVYSTMLRHELSQRFALCWKTAGGENPERVFEEIETRYSEAHRHYHTLAHIAHCLGELDILQLDARDRLAVELAIWFHDVVYEIPGHGNERRSAEYFRKVAAATTLPAEGIERVAEMILASEKHAANRGDDALRVFLDIDLAILGAGPERFKQYDQDIRAEYASIPDAVYYTKRREILQQFLMRDALYLTPMFHERYESQARENLRSVAEICQPSPCPLPEGEGKT